ncbi:hypothetical protein GCM10011506_18240 [Marivirga lumbricoides]|uniref:DUF2490 domain-containing protein n=1 Tax=Marivirga lumbricoides TaxID=1046115 RepID=A0A2T4DDN5_9BACT|nr:DUF2490 domain-containing protein [Marivirga lumbricoides]GGC33152.1 hypothetical protein GCM10011506_18240 [Marivirga lumbricoides]
MINACIKISLIALLSFSSYFVTGQELESSFDDLETNLWFSSYNKFRISDKLFWAAEMHYRRIGSAENRPFIDRMAQIYNRHGINYVHSPKFNITVGGVLRLDFTPEPGNEELKPLIIEPRIWHQYLFVMPFSRFMLYHRIRIEHRWSTNHRPDSEWLFRNRWRYSIYAKIPLNNPQLVPGTVYFSPSVELILQTGKPVVGSFIEDFRLYGNFGYIVSPRVSASMGLMYTTGQKTSDPTLYRRRYILRVSTYISLDFRKKERKIPAIKLSD